MTIITSELVANASAVLVANATVAANGAANTANLTRITLAGLVLPTPYGSVSPAESVQVSLYAGANGLSNDVLVFTETFPANNGVWGADIVASLRTVASNLQIVAAAINPSFPYVALSSPSTNGAVNIANVGGKMSVYVNAVGGGSNGTITVETGAVSNVV